MPRSVVEKLLLAIPHADRIGFQLLALNAVWSLIAHILGRGSLVVASIVLARNLGTHEFAAYSYFQLTVSMLAAYSALGMGVTASRFFAETGFSREGGAPPVGTLWILSVVTGLILAALIISLPDNLLGGGLGIPGWLIALGVFVMALGVVPAGGILGLERYREATLASAMAAVVVVIGASIAGKAGSAVGAMLAFVLSALVQTIGNTYVVVRNTGAQTLLARSRFGKAELRRIALFAGPMTAVTLFSASGAWIVGRIILGGPSGKHGFSLYVIGLQWFSMALLFPGMISRVVLPRMVRERLRSSTDTSHTQNTLVRQAVCVTLISSIAMCVVGGLLSPWLWSLYGIDDYSGAWLIVAFMIAALPAAPANTLGNAILADDGQMDWLRITVVWFLCLILFAGVSVSLGAWTGPISLGFGHLMMALAVARTIRRRNLV